MSAMPAGYKQTEVGVIPEKWVVSTISKSMRLINGCAFKPNEWRKQGVPIIRIQNLNDPSADFNYFQGAIDEKNRVVEGDVLFAWSGTLGSSFGARIWSGPDGVLNQHIFKVIADERVFTKQYSYLIFKRVQEDIEKKSHGFKSSFVHVKKADIDTIQLPIPPLPEQRAIAAALSDVDALLAKLDQLITKKRDLKQATMQQLLTGQTRLPGFSGAWEVVKAGDIGLFRGGSGFPIKFQGRTTGEFPLFKVSDMNNAGNETFMEFANNFISDSLRKQLGASAFPAESIVFAKVGAAVFLERKKILCQASCLDNNMTAFVLDSSRAHCRFIHFVLLNTKLGSLVSTTALPSLSGSVLSAIELPLPPLPEQTAIATVLADMDAELAALEARRDKTRAIKQGMMQELLTGRIRLV